MKLKYKNFEFIQNPQKITVKKSKSVGLKPLPGLGTEAQEICDDAAVIKIYGRFYGKDGDKAVKKLYALQAQKQAGALLLPGGDYFNAYFTSFETTRNAAENYISYEAQFTESQIGKNSSFVCKSTFAQNGENAFEIAARCGVSVEKIMKLNSFKTPFEVPAGAKVIID